MNEDPRINLKKFKVWGTLLLIVASVAIWLSISLLPSADKLPPISIVPEWSLLNQFSQPFGSHHLKGKVYIANFAFSRCPSVCPRLMTETSKLVSAFQANKDKVNFVTFTVDPEYDTAAVLSKWSQDYPVSEGVWWYLTSDSKTTLFKLYTEGFKVGVDQGKPVGDLFDIAHSEKMVLVDQQARIRGIYTYDEAGLSKIKSDVSQLLEQP